MISKREEEEARQEVKTPEQRIVNLNAKLHALRAPIERVNEELSAAFEDLRRACAHDRLLVMRGRQTWGDVRRCINCGLTEDETIHSTGFHVLRDRTDVWMKRVRNLDEWNKLSPARTLLIEWCYGDKDHPQHYVPYGTLTKGRGTRCKDYEGSFE